METQTREKPVVPTVDFEYDAYWTGGESDGEDGNYINKTGALVQIPTSLIDASDEKTAFEQFTSLSRCHIVHWECEESDDEMTQDELDEVRAELTRFASEHAKTCSICARLES